MHQTIPVDYVVVHRQQLPHDGGTWELEGRDHLGVGASVIMVEMPPGRGVRLHLPHAFVNSGDIPLRQTDVHLSERFVTEWLED